jgi:hypothetical protein
MFSHEENALRPAIIIFYPHVFYFYDFFADSQPAREYPHHPREIHSVLLPLLHATRRHQDLHGGSHRAAARVAADRDPECENVYGQEEVHAPRSAHGYLRGSAHVVWLGLPQYTDGADDHAHLLHGMCCLIVHLCVCVAYGFKNCTNREA